MALLEEPKARDRVDQLLAFVLTLVCVALAVYAIIEIRVVIALASELADLRRAQFRLTTIVGVIVLALAWFVYTLWVVDSHQQGYTLARIARAQGKSMPVRFTNRPVMPWLWQHNLHLAVARFLRNALVPLVVLILARIASEVLQALVVGKP